MDNLSSIIKCEVEKKYGSIAAFSREMNIPYTTLSNLLSKNLINSKFLTIIMICKKLNISLFDIDKESFEDNDIEFLTKLTALDEHGKYVVDSVIEKEYERSIKF